MTWQERREIGMERSDKMLTKLKGTYVVIDRHKKNEEVTCPEAEEQCRPVRGGAARDTRTCMRRGGDGDRVVVVTCDVCYHW